MTPRPACPTATTAAVFSIARAIASVRQCIALSSPAAHAAGTTSTWAPASTSRRADSGNRRS